MKVDQNVFPKVLLEAEPSTPATPATGARAMFFDGALLYKGDDDTIHGVVEATDPGDIAAPASATTEDVATKLNELMAALRASVVLAGPS